MVYFLPGRHLLPLSSPLIFKCESLPSLTIALQALIEKPLVDTEVVPEGFINSWALNMYHDGSEGIQSHFDDAVRFLRPIYSLRYEYMPPILTVFVLPQKC